MKRLFKILLWIVISLLGVTAVGVAAFQRGEPVNALWLVVAGVCTFAVSYRFYSAWLCAKVLTLDDRRAPPAVTCSDGKDFVPTNKWIVFGHHFAAIAGPGPLVGPVLAAQFGYLPGTLWISDRRRPRRRRAGLRDPLRLDAARRQIARPDGSEEIGNPSPASSPCHHPAAS